jgi:prepilin-type N-terminal cleavage/methylation domain-containing protein
MRRRGFTLLETMVVMIIDAGLAGIALLALCTVIHYRADVDREIQCHAGRTRLAERFRADAHAAAGCQPLGQPGRGCRFTGGSGRRVEYRLDGNRVERTVYLRERLVEHDTFALAEGARPALELPAAVPGVVRLRVTAAEQPGAATSAAPWSVEATLAPSEDRTVEESPP